MFFPLWLPGLCGWAAEEPGSVRDKCFTHHGEENGIKPTQFVLESFCIDEFDLQLQLGLNLTLLYPAIPHTVHISKVPILGEC